MSKFIVRCLMLMDTLAVCGVELLIELGQMKLNDATAVNLFVICGGLILFLVWGDHQLSSK